MSILDIFKVKDLGDDEFDDDLFDDEDEDDDEYDAKPVRRGAKNTKAASSRSTSYSDNPSGQSSYKTESTYGKGSYQSVRSGQSVSYKPNSQYSRGTQKQNNLVDFNRQASSNGAIDTSGVHVSRPQTINDAQNITTYLKNGLTIIINLEGVELSDAQRIIDFVGGACNALGGSISAITGNIFVAAPQETKVSGDLREEIRNAAAGISPQLGNY